jgi:HK97 family phage prohead protease
MTTFAEQCRAAAAERSQHVRSRADRPQQRRDGSDGMSARAHAKITDFEFREETLDSGLTILNFRGYASITNTPYEMWDFFGPYSEEVEGGAFQETLMTLGLDVPLVLQHNDLRRIARTTAGSLDLTEDPKGLLTEARLNPLDEDVQYIRQKFEDRLIDEMSFKFRITEGWWSDDFEQFVIKKVDIHRGDVSIVGYGANPYTHGATISAPERSDAAPLLKRGSDLITDEDLALRH